MRRVLPPDSDAFLHGPECWLFQKSKSTLFFFFIQIKKNASKVDKNVMLGYLLLFNKRLEFDFFNLHPKFPRARAKPTRWKFATFAYYHREKPNLKSLS